MDIAKYKSELELELFYTLMHKTLSFSSDTSDSTFNRHVSCVGLRFRFLVMALSFVQQQHSTSWMPPSSSIAISKWILRERIYYTALDYFTVNSRTPTQSSGDLREDIQYVLEFWNKIVAEKKYLKDENFSLLTMSAAAAATGTAPSSTVLASTHSQSDSGSLTGTSLSLSFL